MSTASTPSASIEPQRFGRLSVVLALLAFAISRAWLLWGFEPVFTDIYDVYLEYSVNGVDLGMMPYKEIPPLGYQGKDALEYPPLGYWLMTVPRLLSSQTVDYDIASAQGLGPYYADYEARFRAMMAVLDLLAFGLFLGIVHRRRPEYLGLAAWTYVLVTFILGHVLHTRLDLGVSLCLFGWMYAWLRGDGEGRAAGAWRAVSYAALGVGFSFKLIPGLIVPLAAISDFRALRSRRDALWLGTGLVLFGLLACGPFAYYYVVAGERVFGMFGYHSARPNEIESVFATLMMAAAPLGLQIACLHGHGSWNIETPRSGVSNLLVSLSSVLIVAVMCLAILRACRPRATFDRVAAYRWGCWVILASMTLAKVLSIQYLIWGLPVCVLLGAELLPRPCFRRLVATVIGMALLSTLVFPYLFTNVQPWYHTQPPTRNPYPLVDVADPANMLHPLPCSLLVLRNAALVGVWIWLTVRLVRAAPVARPPEAAAIPG